MNRFSLKSMLADPMNKLNANDAEVRIFPNRDEVPTQPYSPRGIECHQEPMIPTEIRHEINVAHQIFAELLQVDPEGRDRIMHMVADLLRLYAPVEADNTETPEGAPV